MSSLVVLYAPTLGSPGGYAALTSHYVAGQFDLALVRSPELLPRALMRSGGEVRKTQGHRDGYRQLRDLATSGDEIHLYVAQNPALWPRSVTTAEVLIQNHLFARPAFAIRHAVVSRTMVRVGFGLLATELAVRRTPRLVVLNSAVPSRWRRGREVVVRPNQLAPVAMKPAVERARTVAFVSSFDRFRGLDIALHAFARARLHDDGWEFHVHARRTDDPRFERHIRDLAAAMQGVQFPEASSPLETLATAAVAVFPSAVEGASIAFAEALQLTPHVIALERPHFVEHAAALGTSTTVYWVNERTVEAWARALSDVCRGIPEL